MIKLKFKAGLSKTVWADTRQKWFCPIGLILSYDRTGGAQLSSSYRIKIDAYKVIVHHEFFDQTCIGLNKMDQKGANVGFQSQISESNIDCIHLKMILLFRILD